MSGDHQNFRILFVCLGNICRSPAAEGVMEQLVEEAGLADQVEVDSAGTSGYHVDEPADLRMRLAAEKRGIELLSRSRAVTRQDFRDFDLLIAMDRENRRELLRLADGFEAKVKLLSEYLGDDWETDVPDPYYGGDDGFEHVLNMLQSACPHILESLRN